MNRIRTKIVLSFLVISVLPIFPLYYLARNLVVESREIGFNERVQKALDSAVEISRALYGRHREETVALAEELAASVAANSAAGNRLHTAVSENAHLFWAFKVDVYDADANLVFTHSSQPRHVFPQIYRNTLVALSGRQTADLISLPGDTAHVAASAPTIDGRSDGFVLVIRALPQDFIAQRDEIVRINQMFKTLDLFESELTRGFLLSFFAVYAPIAGLSIGLGYYFSRKITQPLLTLVEGTKRVAQGDWQHRVRAASGDEVGELVAAFNQMVGTLKEKQDQVVALEKMAVWREIARILAHEIKNPLTPIQLTVQQMKDKYPGDDPDYARLLEECTEIVGDEIESLRTLVREFSEFARMPKLNLAPANLNELVEEVSKLYKESRPQLTLDSAIPELNLDYEKMRRVLINLIENGLDAMKDQPDGELTVRTQRQGEHVLLEVSDTGSGIPDDLKQKIFEPYFSTKKSGVGLGLAIVKRIVEEHGGKISLESKGGEGTTIRILLKGH